MRFNNSEWLPWGVLALAFCGICHVVRGDMTLWQLAVGLVCACLVYFLVDYVVGLIIERTLSPLKKEKK